MTRLIPTVGGPAPAAEIAARAWAPAAAAGRPRPPRGVDPGQQLRRGERALLRGVHVRAVIALRRVAAGIPAAAGELDGVVAGRQLVDGVGAVSRGLDLVAVAKARPALNGDADSPERMAAGVGDHARYLGAERQHAVDAGLDLTAGPPDIVRLVRPHELAVFPPP